MRELDDTLAALDAEARFIERRSDRMERFNLEEGETSIIRLLPVNIADTGLWYARVGRHWVAKRPYYCPRTTAEALGGGASRCDICEVIEDILAKGGKQERDAVGKMRETTQWGVFLVELKRWNARNKEVTPYDGLQEWWTYRDTFTDILANFRRFHKPNLPLSILDLTNGCDLEVTRKPRGWTVQRSDIGPAFDGDVEEKMDEFQAQFKLEMPHFLKGRELEDLLVRIEDAAVGRSTRERGRDEVSDEVEDMPRRGRSGRDRPEPEAPRSRSRREPDVDDPPPRASRTRTESVEEAPARTRQARVEPEAEEPASRPSRSAVPARVQREEEEEPPAPLTRSPRTLAPPPARARTVVPRGADDNEEEDDLPSGDAEMAPPEPPVVEEEQAPKRSRATLNEGIRNRVRNIN